MKKSLDTCSVIGFAGLAKNTGKTTTLNYVIGLYEGQVCLTSIGLDGERIDQLTALHKPPITVWPGMVVATAEATLKETRIAYSLLAKTTMTTALGNVWLIRVESRGTLCVAGPTTNRDLEALIAHMKPYHAKILIDGALDRKTFVGVGVVEGFVLSTGAALSVDMTETIERTATVEQLFHLPLALVSEGLLSEAPLTYQDAHGRVVWKTKQYEQLLTLGLRLKNPGSLWVNGALTSRFVNFLKQHRIEQLTVIVEDATKVLLNQKEQDVLNALHIKLFVRQPCVLLAITLNPWSPQGRHYDPEHFMKAAQKRFKTPVYNVLERTSNHENSS